MTAVTPRTPTLLPRVASGRPWMSLAILCLSLLATLEIIAASATVRVLDGWPSRLTGVFTLAVAGRGVESSDAAAARTVELLSRDPRLAKIWVLDPAPGDALAARLMGIAETSDDVAPPRLVAVTARGGGKVAAAASLAVIRAQGIVAEADDHGLWTGPLERALLVGGASAVALMLLLLIILSAVIAGSVRRAFAANHGRVTLLLHLGATDAMLVRPFRSQFAVTAILASALGAATAAALGAVLIWRPEAAIWLAARGVDLPALAPQDIAGAVVWPLAVALISYGAAHRAANDGIEALS